MDRDAQDKSWVEKQEARLLKMEQTNQELLALVRTLYERDLKRAEQEAAAVVGGAAAKAAPNNLANRTKISMEALKKEKLYANFKMDWQIIVEAEPLGLYSDVNRVHFWLDIKKNADSAFEKLKTTRFPWLQDKHKLAVFKLFKNAMRAKNHQIRHQLKVRLHFPKCFHMFAHLGYISSHRSRSKMLEKNAPRKLETKKSQMMRP
eukprot:m.52347 g.52347  ORF g.52347 m.52347 type:complete len:205 (+) comp11767_c1_seq3:133-747(+)